MTESRQTGQRSFFGDLRGRLGQSAKCDAEILLPIALDAAVPLWIATLKARPWDDLVARGPMLTGLLGVHGDDILYRCEKLGGSARAFNALAETIAILSFVPGGVKAFGAHWESRHPELSSVRGQADVLPDERPATCTESRRPGHE